MSSLTNEQRGDLAEQMLPTAAHLAVLVHGDGGPEDVAEVLASLDETQKNALIVVLAGMVDPEQPVGKALGWVDFTEHGDLAVPASWSQSGSIRDLAPDDDEVLGDDYVDQAAVAKFVKGFRVEVTDADFLAAVQECARLGMTLADVDAMRRWPKKTAENWVNRLKKRHQRSGRPFPDLGLGKTPGFSEEAVVRIRERSLDGASDVELSMSYSVTRETIRSIVTGKRYPEFGGPIRTVRSARSVKASRDHMCGHAGNSQAARPASFQQPNAVLTPRDRDAIRQRRNDGEAVQELAAEYQVHTSTIRKIAA
jgi:hypothetical protein